MLAEYTMKFTLDNQDIFSMGMLVGGLICLATFLFVTWYEKK